MLGTIPSCALFGIDAFPVVVEVDAVFGLPGYHVVGLPTTSVREGAVRIRSALQQVGLDLPNLKVTVNLAPGDRPKGGAAFDLPIAVGVLLADEVVTIGPLQDLLMLGELGLDGTLRPVKGALAAALLARELGLRGVLLPAESAAEAAVVDGIEVYRASHLGEVVAALQGGPPLHLCEPSDGVDAPAPAQLGDMSDVRGQDGARLALEVAVAGGHNLLLVGPPGIGKTMLARRIPTILPPMSRDEALETTKVYSALGMAPQGLLRLRPFRAPHHSVSPAALLGGGSQPRPGEISLAHHGVLFLDELPEFPRHVVESLRQPLEDRTVTIGRVHGTVKLPASFLLVASANPCPCGWLGARERGCTCSPTLIARYRSRLSGPVLDRIDLQLYVPQVRLADMRDAEPGESSAAIRARVVEARARQAHRLRPYGVYCNAEMPPRALRATCKLDADGERTLAALHTRRTGMTGRAIDRLIKVARTLADLAGKDAIDDDCLHEASSFRELDVDPMPKGVGPAGARRGREGGCAPAG